MILKEGALQHLSDFAHRLGDLPENLERHEINVYIEYVLESIIVL